MTKEIDFEGLVAAAVEDLTEHDAGPPFDDTRDVARAVLIVIRAYEGVLRRLGSHVHSGVLPLDALSE